MTLRFDLTRVAERSLFLRAGDSACVPLALTRMAQSCCSDRGIPDQLLDIYPSPGYATLNVTAQRICGELDD